MLRTKLWLLISIGLFMHYASYWIPHHAINGLLMCPYLAIGSEMRIIWCQNDRLLWRCASTLSVYCICFRIARVKTNAYRRASNKMIHCAYRLISDSWSRKNYTHVITLSDVIKLYFHFANRFSWNAFGWISACEYKWK